MLGVRDRPSHSSASNSGMAAASADGLHALIEEQGDISQRTTKNSPYAQAHTQGDETSVVGSKIYPVLKAAGSTADTDDVKAGVEQP